MLKGTLLKAIAAFLIFTIVCGAFYTGVITGVAQLVFPKQANGSIIEVDGKSMAQSCLTAIYGRLSHVGTHYENRCIDLSR